MLTSSQVLAVVGGAVLLAFASFFGGRVLFVWACWHLDRLDDEVDALFPADQPREH